MIVFGEALVGSFFRLAFLALLSYVALWMVDTLRPVDVSWRRRLLFVALSTVIALPVNAFGIVITFALFFVLEWVLLKWIYSDSWKDAAIRVLVWIVVLSVFVLVFEMVRILFSPLFG